MKLAIAALLLLAPAFAQSRWYDGDAAQARRDRMEARREAQRDRMEAQRDARRARTEAMRESRLARAEAQREAVRIRRETYRISRPAPDRWDREALRRELREVRQDEMRLQRELRRTYIR